MKHIYSGKSLLELRNQYGTGSGGFYDNTWWLAQDFASDRAEPREYELCIEKKALHWLTCDEQKAKLPEGYEFPHPAVLAEALLVHFNKTGEHLMKDWYSRTSLLASGGDRVVVGRCDAGGVGVSGDWVGFRFRVGVGPCRKLSSIKPRNLESLESLDARVAALERWKDKITQP